jgi:hypothetical protein
MLKEISSHHQKYLKCLEKLIIWLLKMVGIWCLNYLQTIDPDRFANNAIGKKRLSLIEFGPGKGTLMRDVVRVLLIINQGFLIIQLIGWSRNQLY